MALGSGFADAVVTAGSTAGEEADGATAGVVSSDSEAARGRAGTTLALAGRRTLTRSGITARPSATTRTHGSRSRSRPRRPREAKAFDIESVEDCVLLPPGCDASFGR